MDLSKILKGHEGKTFYSAIFGDIILETIEESKCMIFSLHSENPKKLISYTKEGMFDGLGMDTKYQVASLFPSRENQNWVKWEKEHPAVEQYKVGQYVKKDLGRYQITNITENVITICNIKTGTEVAVKKDDINRYTNKKELTVINNIEDILEPFDKVLVQFREDGPWKLDFYSNFDGSNTHCINHCVTKTHILPYYPNKHLFDNGKK